MRGPAVRATQVPAVPLTMGRVVRHMLALEARVLASPVVPATTVLAARMTADREAPATAVLVARHMMDPEDRRIQGREDHAMQVPVVRAIRVPVEPVEGVHRFADESRIILGE